MTLNIFSGLHRHCCRPTGVRASPFALPPPPFALFLSVFTLVHNLACPPPPCLAEPIVLPLFRYLDRAPNTKVRFFGMEITSGLISTIVSVRPAGVSRSLPVVSLSWGAFVCLVVYCVLCFADCGLWIVLCCCNTERVADIDPNLPAPFLLSRRPSSPGPRHRHCSAVPDWDGD